MTEEKRIIPTTADIARLKGLGFLRDKTTDDCFHARVITRNGKVRADTMEIIAEAARRFGSGEVTLTTRLTFEIQRIPFANIEPFLAYLAQHGLETGGTGPRVRPIVSCKGTTCQYGLIDTFALSEKIHERFYRGYHNVKLPHKFKIAVGGCPNNCVKPDLNDLGIIGQRIPAFRADLCRHCKTCAAVASCPMKAAATADGSVQIDPTACNHCGRCIKQCPFGAMEATLTGYRVFIGGRWGKKTACGQALHTIFTSEEDVLALVEKCILLFCEQGIAGERFADTVARLGLEQTEALLSSDDLLARRETILAHAQA